MLFISRDKRTHQLFRKSWIKASDSSDNDVIVMFRKSQGLLFFLISVFKHKLLLRKICVFGVSEALVLSFLSPNLIVITGLGRLLMPSQKFRKLFFFIIKFFYKNRLIVVLNMNDLRIFRSIGCQKCILINGEGIDLTSIRAFNNQNLDFNPRRNKNFLYAGRLLKSKNVDQLVDYFDELFDQDDPNMSATLTLVGDNDFGSPDSVNEKTLQRVASKHPDKFKLVGYQSDVKPFMKGCDVYISLSKREGLPFSVVEALALGCECILSDVPGHKAFKPLAGVTLVKGMAQFENAVYGALQRTALENAPSLEEFSQETIVKDIHSILCKL